MGRASHPCSSAGGTSWRPPSKSSSQSGSWKGSSSLGSRLCSVRCECLQKLLLHSAQGNGFPWCGFSLKCSVSLDCQGKVFWHSAQENSLCLLWIRLWQVRARSTSCHTVHKRMAFPHYGTLVGLHGILPGEGPPTLWTRKGLLPAVLTDGLLGFFLGGKAFLYSGHSKGFSPV